MRFVINKNRIRSKTIQSNKSLIMAWMFLESRLKERVRHDTGDLKRSITTESVSQNHVRVWSNKVQAYIEERWRKPGKFPNLNALVWWAWRHGMISWKKTQWYDSLPSKDKSVVFLIWRSIARKWIEAKWTFTKVWEQYKSTAIAIYFNNFKR